MMAISRFEGNPQNEEFLEELLTPTEETPTELHSDHPVRQSDALFHERHAEGIRAVLVTEMDMSQKTMGGVGSESLVINRRAYSQSAILTQGSTDRETTNQLELGYPEEYLRLSAMK